jgi:hypothetical protein
MTNERNWLEAEKSGDDAFAETMFARTVAAMPAIPPSADFGRRAVQVAWQARARRRILERLAGLAAALTIGIVALGTLYESGARAKELAVGGVVIFSHGLVWVLSWVGSEAKWWWIGERIGTAVSGAVIGRSTAGALVAAEMIILLSIYALQRLVPSESEVRESRKA